MRLWGQHSNSLKYRTFNAISMKTGGFGWAGRQQKRSCSFTNEVLFNIVLARETREKVESKTRRNLCWFVFKCSELLIPRNKIYCSRYENWNFRSFLLSAYYTVYTIRFLFMVWLKQENWCVCGVSLYRKALLIWSNWKLTIEQLEHFETKLDLCATFNFNWLLENLNKKLNSELGGK